MGQGQTDVAQSADQQRSRATTPSTDATAAGQTGDAIVSIPNQGQGLSPDVLNQVLTGAYGPGALRVAQEGGAGAGSITPGVGGDGFQIAGLPASRPVDRALMEQYADQFEEACNGGWTGIGTDNAKVRELIQKLSHDEFQVFNDIFATKHGVKYAGRNERWDVLKELEDEVSSSDLATYKKLIDEKSINEIPVAHQGPGDALLKPGSQFKVGEVTNITMADGREYGVYVPKNADLRGPVIIAMHGAGAGDGKNVMFDESGLTIDAEKFGNIVVFAYPKARDFNTQFGTTQGVAWNIPGRIDLPKQETNSYDDRTYIDNIIADLGRQANVQGRVGLYGFSDGGRFANAYAADRPDKVAGIVSIEGTWMKGDTPPASGVPIRIYHGGQDATLPYGGGPGSMGNKMDWIVLGTNLNDSAPYMQKDVWSAANGCTGEPRITQNGDTTITMGTNCSGGDVIETRYANAGHGLHTWKNNGNTWIQWALGEPDRTKDVTLEATRFLRDSTFRRGS